MDDLAWDGSRKLFLSLVPYSHYIISLCLCEHYLKGYREMLRRIEPERIICYNEPFPEMEGNIVFINYELSSWKYQNESYIPSKYLTYILGEQPLPAGSKIHIKSGCVLRENKGMGSAQGGPWKPAKPADERFIGEPGTIKDTWVHTSRGGYRAITKLAPTERQLKNGISPITGVPDHIQSHTAIQSGGPTGFRFRGRQSMIQVGLQSLNDTEGFIE